MRKNTIASYLENSITITAEMVRQSTVSDTAYRIARSENILAGVLVKIRQRERLNK